jgi:para-aminobenzoate synthetase component 1
MRQKTFEKCGWRDPVQVLRGLTGRDLVVGLVSDGVALRGRWSYIAAEPSEILVIAPGDPANAFAQLDVFLGPLDADQARREPGLPPFQGGLVGLASYELGARAEPVVLARADPWPDLVCGRYDGLLAFDHHDQVVWAIGVGAQSKALAAKAAAWLDLASRPGFAPGLAAPLVPIMSADAYEAAVAKVIAKIAAGEIFQANIARGWQGRLASGAHPLDLLQRLHVQSPAPFAGYMAFGDLALVSNSPERFLQIQPGNPRLIEARPIKGTIGRGRDEVEDQGQIEALTQSAKDRAENLMIVDLMRNDLARICRPGSVAVPSLFAIETFANLHHLVSTVVGEVLPDLGVGAVLRATYPPGSITGAPKVQAMRVIAGIEPPRGPYCGSLFWAGYDGGLDSSVLIRTTAFVRDAGGWAFQTHAGAGIVADSDPVSERRETQTKISAIALALSGVLA